jgi:hypothetical protein
VVLNGQSGALELYAVDATGAATLAASAALPAGYCAAGGRYVIEAIKRRLSWSMSVTRGRRRAGRLCLGLQQHLGPANSARMMGARRGEPQRQPRIDWYEHGAGGRIPAPGAAGRQQFETSALP